MICELHWADEWLKMKEEEKEEAVTGDHEARTAAATALKKVASRYYYYYYLCKRTHLGRSFQFNYILVVWFCFSFKMFWWLFLNFKTDAKLNFKLKIAKFSFNKSTLKLKWLKTKKYKIILI